ncbi:MAG: hypothetical protein QOE61_444 [Micromonosporaceae bacterium]|jgi:hypothetical protein|nr:hypothetical protein [Micromonosporaceae bacterium]
MTGYTMPVLAAPPAAVPGTVYTVASGDLRPSANLTCWPTQQQLESDVTAAVAGLGWRVRRGHEVSAERRTGSSTASGPGSRSSNGFPRTHR